MPRHHQPNHSASISFSQNFLTGKHTIRRIIRIAGLNDNDSVVEIGAGRGHITRELTRTCGHVQAYEIDPKLAGRLISEFGGTNVRVHRQDFLTAALPKNQPYKVFANIPFNRTSEIVRKLATHPFPPDDAWLVIEKGAAKRFMGQPRESRASLLLKPFFDMEIRYYFQREDFHPAPSVDTVLFRLKHKTNPDVPLSQRRVYESFVDKNIGRLPRVSGEMLYVQWLCLFRRWRGIRP
jgi:23S rRNA (adenine-N6)-dimethyltransferase